jgi:anaerobic dimethyl sulfoxide reductase subunit B (iron-sulfur subunit)
MAKQSGFFYDATRCIQCRTCEVACKTTRNTEAGIRWRKVIETWNGAYPSVTRDFFSLSCMHCENPACAAACPTGAITKRAEDGIVVVDKNKCNGCQDCFSACPYGVPQFGKDGVMQKCDFCIEIGGEPACAVSCPSGALNYITVDGLLETTMAKNAKRMDGATRPSMIIRS